MFKNKLILLVTLKGITLEDREKFNRTIFEILEKVHPLLTLSGLLITSASVLFVAQEIIGTFGNVPIYLFSAGLTCLFGAVIYSLFLWLNDLEFKSETVRHYIGFIEIGSWLFFGTFVVFLVLALIELFMTPFGYILTKYFAVGLGFFIGSAGYVRDRLKWKDSKIGLNPFIVPIPFIIIVSFYLTQKLSIEYLSLKANSGEIAIIVASLSYGVCLVLELILRLSIKFKYKIISLYKKKR